MRAAHTELGELFRRRCRLDRACAALFGEHRSCWVDRRGPRPFRELRVCRTQHGGGARHSVAACLRPCRRRLCGRQRNARIFHVDAAKHGLTRAHVAILRPVQTGRRYPAPTLQREFLTISGPVPTSGPSTPPHLAITPPGSLMTGARSHTRSGGRSPDSEDYQEG